MSNQCKERFTIGLRFYDVIMGIGLIIIGIYRFVQKPSLVPREIFLSTYYVGFGVLLVIFGVFTEKVYSCFRLLSYNLGKAVFLLFLATITCDIQNIPEFIICVVIAIGLIMNIVFFCIFREAKTQQKPSSPVKSPKKGPSDDTSHIVVNQRPDLPEPVKKPESGLLQRRQ